LIFPVKKIKRLVNEIKNTGEHSVMWDGTDLNNKSVPSGVYFYVLKNDQGLF
jgi:flagellar hook assembly protein FlgD